jgi:signal transduction histidine kinase
MESLLEDFSKLRLKIESKLSEEEVTELLDIEDDIRQSLDICLSSCKLLMFNVEDIMALPQLKDGKFTKMPTTLDIMASVKEVMSIQRKTVFDKEITLDVVTGGFQVPLADLEANRLAPSDFTVVMDEKRFQQVLLNLQSNAIKFVDKADSKVLISLQLVRSFQNGARDGGRDGWTHLVDFLICRTRDFFGSLEILGPTQVEEGQIYEAIDRAKLESIYRPEEEADKLVLSVLDNGVGIKVEDQVDLFKLFGCLKQTRKMNTKGVGLGLVISKMISEEFGGMV